MVSTKKTIKPINDTMDNVARAVVKPCSPKENKKEELENENKKNDK